MRNDSEYLSDREAEAEVNYFLSCNWDYLSPERCIFIDDRDLQFRGVDLSCKNGAYIDAKIKNKGQINEIWQYPSVEILINNGNNLGWFTNPNCLTHAYMFLSLFSDNTDFHTLRASLIQKVNVLVFLKKALVKFIEEVAPMSLIVEDARELFESYEDRKNYYKDGKKVFHLKKSCPDRKNNRWVVNLVLNRDILVKLGKEGNVVNKHNI